jgi:hypothetical protein
MPKKKDSSERKPEIQPALVRYANAVEIEVPFRKDFNTGLKASIPHQHREFKTDGDRKLWVVYGEWVDTALDVVDLFYTGVVVDDRRKGSTDATTKTN